MSNKSISLLIPESVHRYAKIKAVNEDKIMADTFIELLKLGISKDVQNSLKKAK